MLYSFLRFLKYLSFLRALRVSVTLLMRLVKVFNAFCFSFFVSFLRVVRFFLPCVQRPARSTRRAFLKYFTPTLMGRRTKGCTRGRAHVRRLFFPSAPQLTTVVLRALESVFKQILLLAAAHFLSEGRGRGFGRRKKTVLARLEVFVKILPGANVFFWLREAESIFWLDVRPACETAVFSLDVESFEVAALFWVCAGIFFWGLTKGVVTASFFWCPTGGTVTTGFFCGLTGGAVTIDFF